MAWEEIYHFKYLERKISHNNNFFYLIHSEKFGLNLALVVFMLIVPLGGLNLYYEKICWNSFV